MRKVIAPAALLLAAALVAEARASQPCGVYARIDKVEVGPDRDKPAWVKIHGDFIVVVLGNQLRAPVRGFMLCSIVPEREDLCRLESADLQKIAGTDKITSPSALPSRRSTTTCWRPFTSWVARRPGPYRIRWATA